MRKLKAALGEYLVFCFRQKQPLLSEGNSLTPPPQTPKRKGFNDFT